MNPNSCSGCWFADMEGQTDEEIIQIGCEANREDLFIDPITGRTDLKDSSKYRSLDRFCNMYRGIDWATDRGGQDNINLHDNEYMVELARQEIKPSFGVVVLDDNARSFEDIELTLDSLEAAADNYASDKSMSKIKVVVSTNVQKGLSRTMNLVNERKKNLNIVAVFHSDYQAEIKDQDAFKHIVNGSFYVTVESGTTVYENIFNVIENLVNEQCKVVTMAESEGVCVLHAKTVRQVYLNEDLRDMNRVKDYLRKLAGDQGCYYQLTEDK